MLGRRVDYFEPLQSLDGYDIVETLARQRWVLHHKVGLMGISYGGISQLFVAQTNPPHLEAITPLSVIDDSATTLYPGGILNTGFALAWAADRDHDAKPASATGGQPWVRGKVVHVHKRRPHRLARPGHVHSLVRLPRAVRRETGPEPVARGRGRRTRAPIWSFRNTVPAGGRATVLIAHSRQMPSRLILPVVPGVSVPTGLPPCPGLRGEACRRYVPTPGVS